MVTTTHKRKFPVELCTKFFKAYQVNPPFILCPKREDRVDKKEQLVQFKKASILKLWLVKWEQRDWGADFFQTRDSYSVDKQRPRKPDIIHFIKDDSSERH